MRGIASSIRALGIWLIKLSARMDGTKYTETHTDPNGNVTKQVTHA